MQVVLAVTYIIALASTDALRMFRFCLITAGAWLAILHMYSKNRHNFLQKVFIHEAVTSHMAEQTRLQVAETQSDTYAMLVACTTHDLKTPMSALMSGLRYIPFLLWRPPTEKLITCGIGYCK